MNKNRINKVQNTVVAALLVINIALAIELIDRRASYVIPILFTVQSYLSYRLSIVESVNERVNNKWRMSFRVILIVSIIAEVLLFLKFNNIL